MLLLRDVTGTAVGGSLTVRVADISPKIFAPRVELADTIAAVELDGKPWHYFDGRYVFLPQKRGTYSLEVTYGVPTAPRLAVTFAGVSATGWDGETFSFSCEWNEWSEGAPDGFRYHAAIRLDGRRPVHVENAEVVRTIPLFEEATIDGLSGEGSIVHMVPRSFHDAPFKPLNPNGAVVVRFLPGTVRMRIEG